MTRFLIGSALLYDTRQKKTQKLKSAVFVCVCVCVFVCVCGAEVGGSLVHRAINGLWTVVVGLLRSPGTLAASLAAELVKINIPYSPPSFSSSSSVLSVSRFYFCESRLSSVPFLPLPLIWLMYDCPSCVFVKDLDRVGRVMKSKEESLWRRQRHITYVPSSEPPRFSKLPLGKCWNKFAWNKHCRGFWGPPIMSCIKLPNEKYSKDVKS